MRWLTDDWHGLMPLPWCNIALAFIAALCGAIVGTERERKEKPTGTRTLTLVSLGSAVFTLLSGMKGTGDGRIAAQIISGVGFLGAGAIIRGRVGVIGLTSAATIWAVAAIGMTVGFGYAVAGLVLSFFVLAVLTVISRLEQRYVGLCRLSTAVVTFDPAGGKTVIRIEELLDEFEVPGQSITQHTTPAGGGPEQVSIHYCCVHKHHRELLARLAEIQEVQEMRHDVAARRGLDK